MMNMMKKLFVLSILAVCALPSWATTVNRQQARQQAETFLRQHGLGDRLSDASSVSTRRRASAEKDAPYYVFNIGNSDGFIVMAADDCVDSVLGYSTGGSFDADNLPDGLSFLLASYEEQIAYARSTAASSSRRRVVGNDIGPMIQTRWNQRSPYNDKCFTVGTSTALTGCVATAMAQVMNYWQYPVATLADIPAYTTRTRHYAIGGVPAGSPLSWDGSDDFVASLCSYCGKAVKMDYDSHGKGEPMASAAALANVSQAMKDYFGYYQGMRYYQKNSYQGDWAQLVYDGLQVGPVLLGGQDATEGGHVFICDGYQSATGLFHMNWGWGGQDDNYFQLLLCNPTGYQFSNNLEVLTNIKPDDGTFSEAPVLTVSDMGINSATHYTRTNSLRGFGSQASAPTFVWELKSDLANSYDFEMKLMAYKTDGTDEQELASTLRTKTLDPLMSYTFTNGGTWFGGMTGTYKIIPVCRLAGTDSWTPCVGTDAVYLTAVMTSTTLDLYVGEPGSVPEPEVTEEQLSELYASYDQLLADIRTFFEDRLTGQDLQDQNLLFKQYQEMAIQVNAQADELSSLVTQIKSADVSSAQKQQLSVQYNHVVEQRSQAIQNMNAFVKTYNAIASQRQKLSQEVQTLYNTITIQYSDLKNVDTKTELAEKQELKNHFDTQLVTSQGDEQELAKNLAAALATAADLQQQVEAVNTAVAELQAAVQEAIRQSDEQAELAGRKAAATKTLADITSRLTDVYNEYSSVKNQLSQLTEKVRQDEARIRLLTDSLADIRQRLEGDTLLADTLRTPLASRLSALSQQLQQQGMQSAALLAGFGELTAQLTDGMAQIAEVTRLVVTLKNGVADATNSAELDPLQKAIDDLQTQSHTLQAQVEQLKRQLAGSVTDVQATADELTRQAADIRQLSADVEEALAQAEADKQAAEQAELAGRKVAATKTLADITSRLTDVYNEYSSAKNQLSQLTEKARQDEARLRLLTDSLADIRQRLEGDTLLADTLRTPLASRLLALSQQLQQQGMQSAALLAGFDELTAQLTDGMAQIAEVTRLVVTLENSVADATNSAELDLLQKAIDELQTQSHTLQAQAEQLKRQLAGSATDVQATADELTRQTAAVRQLSSDVAEALAQAEADKQAAELAQREYEAAMQQARATLLYAQEAAQAANEEREATLVYIGQLTAEVTKLSDSWTELLQTYAHVDSVLQAGEQLPAEVYLSFQRQFGEMTDTLQKKSAQTDSLVAVAADLAQAITEDSSRLTFLTDSLAKAQTLLEIAMTKEEAAAQQQAFLSLAADFAVLTVQMADRQQSLVASVAAFAPLLSRLRQITPQMLALWESVDAAVTSVAHPRSPRVLTDYYDLQGRRVLMPKPGQPVIRRTIGADGRVNVRKVMK